MATEETESGIDQADPNTETATDTLHSPQENARLLIAIFVHHFKLLTGESLLASKLSSVWFDKHKSEEDLVSGLEYAKTKQWITPLDEAFRLTEAGFMAASQLRQ